MRLLKRRSKAKRSPQGLLFFLGKRCRYFIEAISARVRGPKNPRAGEMPFAFWNLASAARVALPKSIVSLPFEPGPAVAIVKPCAFKNSCRDFTSAPFAPEARLRVKSPGLVVVVGVVAGVVTAGVVAGAEPELDDDEEEP